MLQSAVKLAAAAPTTKLSGALATEFVDARDFGTIEGEILDPPVKVTNHHIGIRLFQSTAGESCEHVDPLGSCAGGFEVEP